MGVIFVIILVVVVIGLISGGGGPTIRGPRITKYGRIHKW